ncbi:zinc-binding metallopeptidase family protein [Anianabacter salinae]|uniref:zinc-binding metallopeptidase family protein n=1 Tax=Anianabacter salinae TaxID=2851023 RepID=UPI00225E1A3F|nr:putative zinc-binding metallopeptidase [Anianabacter salinae]MBV0910756.1 putative zinc-binding peptidase [Anianabacter salinae]
MQIFRCPSCAGQVYFPNTFCPCGTAIAFDPDRQVMVAGALACANRTRIDCNWVAAGGPLCRSCAMSETVPDLDAPPNLDNWATSERAKRWMLANLARWGWFSASDQGRLPRFRFLSEQTAQGPAPVTMGHADGVITINVSEASDTVRMARQEQLGELYRTMLGHLRHEIAHFLFLRLAEDWSFLNGFRALFGDERADYAAALRLHHGAPLDPGAHHISTYATAHPHEDWAETVAHLLHLVDLLDSALAVGLSLPSRPEQGPGAYEAQETGALLDRAVEVALAVNHVNRALDLPDLYPFVLTQGVRDKLAFAHAALRSGPTGH